LGLPQLRIAAIAVNAALLNGEQASAQYA